MNTDRQLSQKMKFWLKVYSIISQFSFSQQFATNGGNRYYGDRISNYIILYTENIVSNPLVFILRFILRY